LYVIQLQIWLLMLKLVKHDPIQRK